MGIERHFGWELSYLEWTRNMCPRKHAEILKLSVQKASETFGKASEREHRNCKVVHRLILWLRHSNESEETSLCRHFDGLARFLPWSRSGLFPCGAPLRNRSTRRLSRT